MPSVQIKKNEMGGACRIYGGEERCMQGFGEETWRKETTWKPSHRLEDNIKIDLQEVELGEGGGHGLDWSDSG